MPGYKHISIYFLILLSLPGYAVAENKVTVSGYIRDASNGEALIGANILIKGTNIGAATNSYGFYSFSLPAGKYTIIVSYIGYQSISQNMDFRESQTLNVELQVSAVRLEKVIVTAEREDENIQGIEMSVIKLDAKTIKMAPVVLGEVDLIKTIQLLPGVSSVAEGSAGFNVRGGSADQNLVLLDEATIFNASHLLGFFSVFNADVIKEVKLYKAGIPAQYGGRLSSVLDIRQKDGNAKSFNSNAGIGLISSRLLFEGPIKKDRGSFVIAGRRSYADLFLRLIGNDNSVYFYDLNYKGNYTLNDRNRFYLSGYLGRDVFEIADAFSNSWGNNTATARWNHVFNDRLFSNFSFIYSNYDYALGILQTGSAFDWKSNIINYNLKADFEFFIDHSNRIAFGTHATYYDFSPAEITPIDESSIVPTTLDKKYAAESAVYLSYEQRLGERLTLQYGLRFSSFFRLGSETIPTYENNAPVVYNEGLGRYEPGTVIGSTHYGSGEVIEQFYNLEPRFSARLLLNKKSSLKLSYNRMTQYLQLISNTNSPTPLDVWLPSGPYKEPQTGDQVALGYFRNFKDNAYEFSMEGYYKLLHNQLDYVDGAQLLFNNNIETDILSGEGRAYGLELYLKKARGKLTGWLSYTLARSENKVTGLTENDPGINNGAYYPSNHDKTHDLSITGMYQFNKTWSFAANFIYATGRPTTYPVSRYEFTGFTIPQYEDRNLDRLPAYHRLDLSATLHNKLGGEWVFGIYNVYNRQNAASITFRQNEDDPTLTEAVRTTLFGLVPSVTYNIKF